MKKKITLFLTVCLICLCFTGCGCQRAGDGVNILNKSTTIFDDVCIEVKDGYFYDKYEKFTVDENTIGLTIYFSKEGEETWD